MDRQDKSKAAQRRNHLAVGASPRENGAKTMKPRSGDRDIRRNLSPLRGFVDIPTRLPWACAHGYDLPPLRGFDYAKSPARICE
jgi:hypothetical protein